MKHSTCKSYRENLEQLKNNVIYDIVRYASDILDRYKRIYVPLGLLIEPEMAYKLKEFVKSGGTLIIEVKIFPKGIIIALIKKDANKT